MMKRSTELIIPFSGNKLGYYDINGNVLSVMENLYRKTKACVDVNGSLTDVFECSVGVRQGGNLRFSSFS